MTLPPFTPGKFFPWHEYKVDKPTFEMGPLEKADMSPFLIHMTGKNEIKSILSTGGTGKGTIYAQVPKDGKSSWYEAKVACFTESPTFSLDAFRYIKFRRWEEDHRFGIGFSKAKLVRAGVRPVLYFDQQLMQLLAKLNEQIRPNPTAGLKLVSKQLRDSLLPLTMPLLENNRYQGFTWEREWRFSGDFVFDHADVEIICCPKEEREEVLEILGDHAKNVKITETWSQYESIKEFFKSRESEWSISVSSSSDDELMEIKHSLLRDRTKIEAFEKYIKSLSEELSATRENFKRLNDLFETVEKELKDRNQKEIIEDYCVGCGTIFEENPEVARILWNDDDQEKNYLCSDCHYRAMGHHDLS